MRNKRKKNKSTLPGGGDGGYIVVETIGVFIPFVFLVVSILSLVNIVTVQARIHYALTQAANTLSMYCYTLEVTGIANDLTTLDNKAYRVAYDANALKNDIQEVLSGIESISDLSSAIEHGGSAAGRTLDLAEEAAGDPKAALQLLMNYGVAELRNKLFEELVRPLVGRYLSNGGLPETSTLKGRMLLNAEQAEPPHRVWQPWTFARRRTLDRATVS